MFLNSISSLAPTTIYMLETKKESKSFVTLDIQPDPVWPAEVINSLATIEGPVDIYCWYEGPACLPIKGATFMLKYLFEPLFELKKDAKLFLYSLNGWNFNPKIIAGNIPQTTALGRAIVEIAFMLPNDEAKYYQDYPQDIEKMLQADFGDTLNDMEINIRFRFFNYDPQLFDSNTWNEIEIDKSSRPYLGLVKSGCVSAKQIKNYLPKI